MQAAVITLNLPDDVDVQDVAIWVDWRLGDTYFDGVAGNPVDCTVWTIDDFIADMEELANEKLREGSCFRCGAAVQETYLCEALDGEGRTDCPESENGSPHEIDAPDDIDEPT